MSDHDEPPLVRLGQGRYTRDYRGGRDMARSTRIALLVWVQLLVWAVMVFVVVRIAWWFGYEPSWQTVLLVLVAHCAAENQALSRERHRESVRMFLGLFRHTDATTDTTTKHPQ